MKDFLMLAQASEATGQDAPPAGESQETTNGTKQTDKKEGEPQNQERKGLFSEPGTLIMMLAIFFVMWFMVFRGPKKKQQQQKKMLADLKKNDRVRTIGGIIGTVVDIRDDEVVIKIDESNNTKMRVVRNAINTVIAEEQKA